MWPKGTCQADAVELTFGDSNTLPRVGAYVPPGWPQAVHPPGSSDFEASAITWLLEVVQPEYRQYSVLRRPPAALIPAYRTEGFKLAATSRSVELVEQALHGEAFSLPVLRHGLPTALSGFTRPAAPHAN